MKIIIAPDSFKGSMTSLEAAESIQAGIAAADKAGLRLLMTIHGQYLK
jgi:glycerate kinase